MWNAECGDADVAASSVFRENPGPSGMTTMRCAGTEKIEPLPHKTPRKRQLFHPTVPAFRRVYLANPLSRRPVCGVGGLAEEKHIFGFSFEEKKFVGQARDIAPNTGRGTEHPSVDANTHEED